MTIRGGLIVLAVPKAPDADPPFCKWCGQEIVYTDLANGNHKRRSYHRGDKFEEATVWGGENRPTYRVKVNCRREFRGSFCWSARDAVCWRAWVEQGKRQFVLRCVDCEDVLCEGTRGSAGRGGFRANIHTKVKAWDADHEIPLKDGGLHQLSNLKARCVRCHKNKTAGEATVRSQQLTA